jgi:hypothetical protein
LCALNVSYQELDEMLEIFTSVVKEVDNGIWEIITYK